MRVAAIRYINSLPLIYGLQRDPSHQVTLDTPSECFQKLMRGEADVALVPVMTTQLDPNLLAVKGLGIASVKRTDSVMLFAKMPLDRIRSVVTDPGSLTSVTLLRVILQKKYGNTPRVDSGQVSHIHDALRNHDAALVIGDQAILTEKTDYDHYDLATEWYSLTQLSFVFAVWASLNRLREEDILALQRSYSEGLLNMERIYETVLQALPVDLEFVKRYYNVNLHYQLTKSDYEGLLKFLTFAADLQIIDRVRKGLWM
jgi:chorismate dehydratase